MRKELPKGWEPALVTSYRRDDGAYVKQNHTGQWESFGSDGAPGRLCVLSRQRPKPNRPPQCNRRRQPRGSFERKAA